jgi:hypothetical protein
MSAADKVPPTSKAGKDVIANPPSCRHFGTKIERTATRPSGLLASSSRPYDSE